VTEPKQYRSNYEYKCAKCGQPIKPRTPYLLRKRYENFHGEKVIAFDREHLECPETSTKR
jgi:DNA-directed RNA polymerase subunit RPC12/RpoP